MTTTGRQRRRPPRRIVMTKEFVWIIPVSPALENIPGVQDMLIRNCDFGPRIGIRSGISVRDFLISANTPKEELMELDKERVKRGLPPVFSDEL